MTDPNSGHRKRTLNNLYNMENINNIPSYLILESLLFFSIPRKDTKPIAKRLLQKFGSISAIINADKEQLNEIDGIGQRSADLIYVLRLIFIKNDCEILRKKSIIDSTEDAARILKNLIGFESRECFVILMLDFKLRLIDYNITFKGAFDSVTVCNRKIIEIIIKNKAKNIIISHNHPSGIAKPSQNDILFSIDIEKKLNEYNANLIDNIIVTEDSYFSFAKNNMMMNK